MTNKHYILKNRKIIEVPLLEWAKWFESSKDRIIKQENIGNKFISTVFLGIDHRFGKGKPLLFETMVFCNNKKDEWHDYQDRYSTYDEAEKGHAKILKRIGVS